MSDKNKNYNYIVIPLLSIGLFLYSIWCGFGYTGDSYMYEEISESFHQDGLAGFNNPWLGNKPPLLSIIIFLIGSDQILFFNLACFIIVIGFSYQLCLHELSDPIIKGLAISITSFALPIYLVNNFLWSEPLFNVCVLFLFYLLQLPAISRKQWFMIILFSNIMILLRHAGVFILIGLFISRFVFIDHKSKWIGHLIMFSFCSLGSIVWFLLAPSSGSAWAETIVSVNLFDKIVHNFNMLSHGFTSWFIPLFVPLFWRNLILIILTIILLYLFRKETVLDKQDKMWLAAGFLYIIFLHGIYKMPLEDGERYFSPLFPIVLLTLFKLINKVFNHFTSKVKRYAILSVISLWCVYSIFRTFNNSFFWHELRCEDKVPHSRGISGGTYDFVIPGD